ncbi:MAG: c-type cytochrome [Rhodospirillales bacterium]|nr:c-type cytochrome [Rhodospirillales bacterium]
MKKLIKISLVAAVFGLAWLINGQTATAAGAEETFKFYCAQCHGLEGKGKGPNVTKDFPVTPRDFTNAKEMSKLSDNYIRGIIMDGGPSQSKSPLMPPWSKTILDVDVNGLIKHLRGLCKCKGKAG